MATRTDKTTVLKPESTKLKPPPMFKVLMHNDDFTPMEFVVDVLQRFFGLQHETAHRVMLQVHTEGRGVCGTFPRDVAQSKMEQVIDHARASNHPLMCSMEEV